MAQNYIEGIEEAEAALQEVRSKNRVDITADLIKIAIEHLHKTLTELEDENV